jgi:oligopeptide/dipeptide ABC transporter ATP-binding protein
MSAALLELRRLSVSFATDDGTVRAVDGIDLALQSGRTLGLVGESGCGKSVTSLAVMGLLPPENSQVSGEVHFEGRDLLKIPVSELRDLRGARLAMIFQEPMTSLNPSYTIGNQIIEAIQRHQGLGAAEARARAIAVLRLVRIPSPERRVDDYPHKLSGGMRQRAMIAMALACGPKLLIADEPTTALDVTIQAQILELIKRLQSELGMAVIFITHNLGVAAEIADRIMVMYAGRIVESGPARAIFHAPCMPYTIGLLNSVPRLGVDRAAQHALAAIPGNVPSPPDLPPGCAFHPRCGFFAPGTCDRDIPPLDTCAPDHAVRCLRWRAVTQGASREAGR